MRRRRLLTSLAAGLVIGTEGHRSGTEPPSPLCVSSQTGSDRPASVGTPEDVEDELRQVAPQDAIPAITTPAFAADWSGVPDSVLRPSDMVVGVTRGSDHSAYPLRILTRHEVVNDALGGPLLVTYCPLCGSPVVAERTVDGSPATFGVSGYLLKGNLVMYDGATGSLWSQLLARAVRGPESGTSLDLLPSRLASWQTWRETHPETKALLPPPPQSRTVDGAVEHDYDSDPFETYFGEPFSPHGTALSLTTSLLGVFAGGQAKAYPLPRVREGGGVVNDVVGSVPVVVATGPTGASLVAYERCVRGSPWTFRRAAATRLTARGRDWNVLTGEAWESPSSSLRLPPPTATLRLHYGTWRDFHPDAPIYGAETGAK